MENGLAVLQQRGEKMRDIKFRMWHKQIKQMYNVGMINFEQRFIFIKHSLNYTQSSFAMEEVELMQFTGLHDKNGKEIYEGDVVRKLVWNELKFEAEGDGKDYSYAKVQYIDELASFHLVNKDNKILWELSEDKYNIEVAGNIYENSDLLKGADNIE